MVHLSLALCLAAACDAASWPWTPHPTVTTALGSAKGTYVGAGKDTAAFFDIPYAETLEPSRRFRQARAKQPWTGELDATGPCGTRGSQCIQSGGGKGEEDCLYLNVWTPKAKSEAPLPVLVFIHGGSFTMGSGCAADGTLLSEQGLVVVSINYRLGALGFLQLEELRGEDPAWPSYGGMNGIGDQLQALRWVQQHIASFGGDPKTVTIWGESAGGESICSLLATPLAAGLFERGIVESGNCVTGGNGYGYGWGPGTEAQGLADGPRVLAALNATDLAALRATEAHELVRLAAPALGKPFYVDGHIYTEHPYENWAAGKLQASSLLIGGNTADGLLERPYGFLLGPALGFSLKGRMSQAEIDSSARAIWGGVMADGHDYTDVMKEQYYPASGRGYNRDDAGIIVAYRDSCIICPSVMMAKFATRANISTYFYGWGAPGASALFRLAFEFDHALPHGLELGAFFGGNEGRFGRLANLFTQKTARSVIEYWASFAKTGVPVDASQGVAWPEFVSSAAAASPLAPYLFFGADVPVVNGDVAGDMKLPTAEDCAMWEKQVKRAPSQELSLV